MLRLGERKMLQQEWEIKCFQSWGPDQGYQTLLHPETSRSMGFYTSSAVRILQLHMSITESGVVVSCVWTRFNSHWELKLNWAVSELEHQLRQLSFFQHLGATLHWYTATFLNKEKQFCAPPYSTPDNLCRTSDWLSSVLTLKININTN